MVLAVAARCRAHTHHFGPLSRSQQKLNDANHKKNAQYADDQE